MSRFLSLEASDAYHESMEPPVSRGPSLQTLKREAAAGCSDASHVALKADPARWAGLKLLGSQDYAGLVIELRNCTCGSTLGLEVSR